MDAAEDAVLLEEPPQAVRTPAAATAAEPAPTAFRKLRRLMEYLDAMVKSPFIIRPVERVPGCFATKPIKLVCYYTFRLRRV